MHFTVLAEFYPNAQSERIAIFNTLSIYYANLAMEEVKLKKKIGHRPHLTKKILKTNAENQSQLFEKAVNCLNEADKISYTEPMTWVGKAQINLMRRKTAKIPGEAADLEKKALSNYDNALQANPDNVPALIGKVRKCDSFLGTIFCSCL